MTIRSFLVAPYYWMRSQIRAIDTMGALAVIVMLIVGFPVMVAYLDDGALNQRITIEDSIFDNQGDAMSQAVRAKMLERAEQSAERMLAVLDGAGQREAYLALAKLTVLILEEYALDRTTLAVLITSYSTDRIEAQ